MTKENVMTINDHRMTLWREAFCAIMVNVPSPESAIVWADKAIEAFDQRFGVTVEELKLPNDD